MMPFSSVGSSRDFHLVWKVTNRTAYNPPSLYHPYDAAFIGENIIVAEGVWPFSRLQIFSGKGRSLQTIGQGRVLPFGVTVNAEGNIVTTDHLEQTVKIFGSNGDDLLSWKPGLFEWPTGIAVDQRGYYYISDWALGVINIHEESGQKVREFKTSCSDGATFSSPAYVALDLQRRIIISDAFDRSVKIFDESGNLLFKIESGSEKGKVVDPRGLCTDGQSNIIVADWGDSCVKLYSSEGRWIRDLLTAEDGIRYPRAVAFSESNLLLVAEQKLNAVPSLKLLG